MSRGKWSRYGRDDCEGYSLCIGNLLRFAVSARTHSLRGVEGWDASLNAYQIGRFETFEAATAAVDREARAAMATVIEDWTAYLADPSAERRRGKRRR